MTPTQTVRLVAIISQIWPSMKLDEHTPDAWHLILDDIDLADAEVAVRHLAKTRAGYISPADIRRQVAAAYGLLPESEASGLNAAAAVAAREGVGSRDLDPVTYAAYRAMGGPTAFGAPMSIIRPQWGKVWGACLREHEDRILGGSLGALVAEKRTAISAAPMPALDAAPVSPEPLKTDRSTEIAAFIRGINSPGDPDKLHSREALWRRMRRVARREPVPNPHFTGYRQPEDVA